MNWDNQLSSILSVAEGSVAKMRVSRFKLSLSQFISLSGDKILIIIERLLP